MWWPITLVVVLASPCLSMDQLHITYEWNTLDFEFPSEEVRQQALDSKLWIPENNIPMGMEVAGNRMFVTVPRWKDGVPASLTYFDMTDNTTSPKLRPYPSWAAHTDVREGRSEIVSPYRVRVDRCQRLWVLDNGKVNTRDKNSTIIYPPSILIYDLNTDTLLRKFDIPTEQVKEDSGFANIAIEDTECNDTYAYAADLGKAGIVVYSWAKNESWRISHHYFNLDPLACNFSVKGIQFTWDDALFGLALSAPNADGFRTLYFHPMASYKEFSVSTEYLRNESIANSNFNAFKVLGDRGPNSQSSAAFLDPKTGVLFYSLVNLNAVACWKTSNKEYTMKNQGRIYLNETTMIYPTDIKVDYNETLWILSNRLPIWMYKGLDANEVNFRVFSAKVVDAISHTACDIVARTNILDKWTGAKGNMSLTVQKGNSALTLVPSYALAAAFVFLSMFQY